MHGGLRRVGAVAASLNGDAPGLPRRSRLPAVPDERVPQVDEGQQRRVRLGADLDVEDAPRIELAVLALGNEVVLFELPRVGVKHEEAGIGQLATQLGQDPTPNRLERFTGAISERGHRCTKMIVTADVPPRQDPSGRTRYLIEGRTLSAPVAIPEACSAGRAASVLGPPHRSLGDHLGVCTAQPGEPARVDIQIDRRHERCVDGYAEATAGSLVSSGASTFVWRGSSPRSRA